MMDLKILASHPIQYQTPIWRKLTSHDCDIRVGYFHQGTAGKRARDVDFGIEVEWDIDLLGGYSYRIFHEGAPDYSWIVQLKTFPSILTWFLQDVYTPIAGWVVCGISLDIVDACHHPTCACFYSVRHDAAQLHAFSKTTVEK